MNTKERKTKLWKKVLLYTLAIVILLMAGMGFLFRSEIKTVNSIKKVDDYGFYTMEYAGDYGFDEFLKVGASNDEELIDFVAKRLLKGLPITITGPVLSCTTFNAVTPGGEFIFGRNFDMGYSPAVLIHTKPYNGYESISMVNLAFLGYTDDYLPDQFFDKILALAAPYVPLDGINEKGLAVGVLLLPDTPPTRQETGKININSTTAIRMLLDKAATVEEAIAMLKEYDMHDSANSCFHYQITDAAGNSTIIEYVNNEMQVLKPKATYQVCTNFFQTPGEKYNFGVGQERYNIVMTGLEKDGVVTPEYGMNLLEAARMIDEPDEKTGIIYNTQWSAVYNNNQKCVDLAIGKNYDKIYHYSVGN